MSWSKKYLTLGTQDKVEIVVEESTAILSKTIRNLVEDNCASNVIPVQVDSITMSKVIEYCSKHVGEEAANEHKKNELLEFDADFAKELDTDMLYHLFLASNYLHIAGLLDLIAQQVVDRIKGKKPHEIREMLNIKNDFTPEEEEKIHKDYAWALD
ncbi:Fimbriata-associated protein [Heracleum sosnowskyi]|uniref:SKP1-like protein n=1 Tax=Heracleum sosnowskyi TaxID=360622 RepID=A0AAD8H3Y5_9APIA|nr:Fimbriata-associated protein [Heracleum sosnowskyi]